MTIESEDGEEVYPIGPENLLLRGACLRNTDYVYACAVYTGQDTKMTLNSKGKRTKFSQVERKLNMCLALILCFLITCSIISTVLSFTQSALSAWYIPEQKITPWIVVQTFLGFIILYNYIIPISLYVTIEVQKFVGSLFFEWDVDMYDMKVNEHAKANTSDLIEEMGQVEYLFTDKTGTLTENSMQFRRFATADGMFSVVGKKIYHMAEEEKQGLQSTGSLRQTTLRLADSVDLPSLLSESTEDSPNTSAVAGITTLLVVLSLCHTVRVERNVPGAEPRASQTTEFMVDGLLRYSEPPKRGSSALRRASAAQCASAAVRASRRGRRFRNVDYTYQASSPDEKAFVEASRDLGVVYHGQDETGMQVVTIQGVAVRYRLLDVLEFDATRKCMSVILQPTGSTPRSSTDLETPVLVLCKGAETAMLSRVGPPFRAGRSFTTFGDLVCDKLCGPSSGMNGEDVMKYVNSFASSGLRTLVMGAKVITASEWHTLKQRLDSARGQLEGREAALNKAISQIENNFTLIGCTGIEDMLQDGVPDTITALREAGIQVWVLTGDKEETAVNISYSAGHFYPGLEEARITKQTGFGGCMAEVEAQIKRMKQLKSTNPDVSFGVVIDGQSLNFALKPPLREKFVRCCLEAATVLCCRLTPLQKAEVVRLIKESRNPAPVTAAIGDGANDVSMILEAHVSFGLFGKEGRQAVRAADYAFGRFSFLRRALLYHGHNYYTRVSTLVLYFFYKNILFTLPQMLFGFFCQYSAQSVYPQIYLMMYNITMTSLPIFLYGLFEQPLSQSDLLKFPILYREIVKNQGLSTLKILMWISLAVWHGFVAFFVVYFTSSEGNAGGGSDPVSNYGGSSVGEILNFGNLLMVTIFIVVNVRVYLFSYYLNWAVIFFSVLAFCLNLAMFVLLNCVLMPFETAADLYGTWSVLWFGSGCGTGWFGLFVLMFLALTPDMVIRTLTDQRWHMKLAALEHQSKEAARSSENESKVEQETNYAKSGGGSNIVQHLPNSDGFDYTNPSFEWGRIENGGNRKNQLPYRGKLPVEELFEQGCIIQPHDDLEPRRKSVGFATTIEYRDPSVASTGGDLSSGGRVIEQDGTVLFCSRF
ncbi:unnamed protein product [Calicophoron daubneyi]|uniref:Phospholipid-transporting ATPase n=1 Tax=Calicophoron daubneyi TaxID=300641 RepID=A0AAV2TN20_CALDB